MQPVTTLSNATQKLKDPSKKGEKESHTISHHIIQRNPKIHPKREKKKVTQPVPTTSLNLIHPKTEKKKVQPNQAAQLYYPT